MTEEEMLVAACHATSDNTPRLVYADWLEENGQADRAAYLRIKVAEAEMPPEPDSTCCDLSQSPRHWCAYQAWNEKYGPRLRDNARRVALLELNHPEWQRHRCPVCDGRGEVTWAAEDGGSPPLRCPGCSGTGDLLRTVPGINPHRSNLRSLTFDRGLLVEVGCFRREAWHVTDRRCDKCPGCPLEMCQCCRGSKTVKRPKASAWLLAIKTALPRLRIRIVDMFPAAHSGVQAVWERDMTDYWPDQSANRLTNVPGGVFDRLTSGALNGLYLASGVHTTREYQTTDEAVKDLTGAVTAWAAAEVATGDGG